MGSRDQELLERRLRPIYDACDAANYKVAIQLADKLLKKAPNMHTCKTLKALALNRLHRTDEAAVLMRELEKETLTDENTLQAATMVYREMGAVDKIPAMYEKAFKASPHDEELANHLFMSLVRIKEFKKQQQLAFQMYKTFSDFKYYYWGVMALVLQAQEGLRQANSETQVKMFLTLAAKYMEKAQADKKIIGGEALDLYLQVLDLQGRHADAAALMESALGDECMKDAVEKRRLRASLAAKASDWTRHNELHRGLIDMNPDDWGSCKAYIESIFRDRADNESRPGDSIEDAWTYVSVLALNESNSSDQRRGPFMARIMMVTECARTGRHPANAETLPTARELLVDYFKRFGHKSCCLADMSTFVDCVPRDQAEAFIADLAAAADLNLETLKAETPKELQQLTCVLQLKRRFGLDAQLSADGRLAWAGRLVDLYSRTIDFGKELKDTEMQYSDQVCILAAQTIADVAEQKGDQGYLYVSASVLLSGLVRSRYSFQMKLAVICLLRTLGGIGLAKKVYDGLEIKHIMHDTMSHLLGLSMYVSANYGLSKSLDGDISQLYRSNNRETPEMTIQAYKNATFSKIYEFVQFRERLDKSIVQAHIETDKIFCSILTVPDSESAFSALEQSETLPADDTTLSSYRDNRDFAVLSSLANPPDTLTEQHMQTADQALRLWLQLRRQHLHCVLAAYRGDKTAFDSNVAALQATLKRAQKHPSTSTKMALVGPEFSPVPFYALCGSALPTLLAPFVLLATSPQDNGLADKLKLAFADTLAAIKDVVSYAAFDKQISNLVELAPRSFVTETLNFLALLALHQATVRDIYKKKKSAPVDPVASEIKDFITALRSVLSDAKNKLNTVDDNWQKPKPPSDLPQPISDLTAALLPTLLSDVAHNQTHAIATMSTVLSHRHDLLAPKK